MDRPDIILVRRLAAMYDPFRILGITVEEAARAKPCKSFVDVPKRTKAYHCGRVAWFANQFRLGLQVSPIDIDNACDRNQILPEPIVTDGHHRLAGAILAGSICIKASYAGRTDLLRFLQGSRKTAPSICIG
jgi:hypothetical protein